MADLFDGLVSESKIFKGAGRVVYAASAQGFPDAIAEVINSTTFALASGWSDFGATTRDGITVTRGFDKDEGVEVDQIAVNVLKGGVKNWRGQVSMTLLHSSLEMMKMAMEADDIQTNGSERYMDVGSPSLVSERRLAVIQKHSKTGKLRVLAFRKASLSPEELSMAFQSEEPTAIPISFDIEADLEIAEADTNMFRIIEEV